MYANFWGFVTLGRSLACHSFAGKDLACDIPMTRRMRFLAIRVTQALPSRRLYQYSPPTASL